MSTKQLADLIVSGLEAALRHASLPSIRSIYIYGSYCRGDWLDCSSDLDVGTGHPLAAGYPGPAERGSIPLPLPRRDRPQPLP